MHWIVERLQQIGAGKTAIICNGQSFSFADLHGSVLEFSRSVASQIAPGEVVALHADYSFASIAAFLALADNKNVVVPITSSVDEEIDERLTEAQVDTVVGLAGAGWQVSRRAATGGKHPIISGLVGAGNTGLVLFSSGSTGRPKAMVHNLDALIETYRDKRPKDLNILVFLMFDHIGGLNTLFNTLAMGTTMVIPESREPDHICSLIEKYAINVLPASPTFLNLLLMSGAQGRHDLSCLKMITYGTEPMPASLLRKFRLSFPRVKFLQTFGTSETGIAQTTSKSSGSTLLKIEGGSTEYKVVDNELWLKSKTRILGYLNASMECFTADGWFKTGDLVEVTDDGFINIVGRNRDVINVGGNKVLPSEIESVLLSMDEVTDCTVFALPNPIMGQMVAVDLVVRPGVNSKEVKQLIRAFCKDKLENYKIPAKVNVVSHTDFSDRFKKSRKKEPPSCT